MLITYKSWEQLVHELGGITWKSNNPLPNSNIVFCTCDHVDNLFRDILENEYTKPFILVSGASDFGPAYRQPFWVDIQKWVMMDPQLNQIGYHDYVSRSRHEKTRCLDRDKYCNKAYSFTASTFPCVPLCIKRWFCTNANIFHERLTNIPFGINPDSIEEITKRIGVSERKGKPLASWTNYTNERMQLQSMLNNQFITGQLSREEFFSALKQARFCVCPEGNGLDSYRILESIYLGVPPIIVCNSQVQHWIRAYELILPNILDYVVEIKDFFRRIPYVPTSINPTEYIYLGAWRSLIESCMPK